ncbi:YolD-like family protein [Bacillus sp. ISL-75]|uniref:YolD-like family protein n=1 Tax=Bacillus sp. ISL-75 TaxID=2819137 RepID=UPI001BE7B0A3|nr:YolD-like family protein [Bacillus sp. ISL-75]MBT2730536.1 YolD-like family protein [Bacillus sp. ISL-75]
MNKDHKDRGMKKWNGFFVPETIKMLKDLWEDDHKTPRPHLDETKIEEMERLLFECMATKKLLEITIWTNGFFTSRVGFVTKIDPLKKKIQIQAELGSTINLDFFSLTNVMGK